MDSSLLHWVVAAVLLFWCIGAYNRLVRLRGEAVSAFAAVDGELLRQVRLVQELLAEDEEGGPASIFEGSEPSFWGGLRGAAAQLEASLAQARQRPLEPARIAALGAAQVVLADAWERAERDDAHDLAGPRLPDTLTANRAQMTVQCIAAADRFSRAVEAYNAAIAQFPAVLLAVLFGFKAGRGMAGLPAPKGPAV